MGATRDIAEFATKTCLGDMDEPLMNHVKNVLLSYIGMTLAGVNSETGKAVLAYVEECAGPSQATVIGAGFQSSTEYAALANGTTSHTTELEDDTRAENMYSVGVFPAILALSEKVHASGREVLEAFVVAWDVASKVAIVAQPMIKRGLAPWSAGATIGVAAGAARLLRLNVHQTEMAISIATSHASGLFKQVGSGAHLYESGLACRNGLAAATLAKHGLTGQPTVLESPFGYMDAVASITEPDLKLGHPYRALDIEIKKYPCCLSQMHPIEACVKLIAEHQLKASDVEKVTLDAPPSFRLAATLYQHPKTQDEAKFSLAHSLACSFLDTRPWLHRYTTDAVNDPEVNSFRNRIEFRYSDDLAGQQLPITVSLRDGNVLTTKTQKISKTIFVSDAEVLEKYRDCTRGLMTAAKSEAIAEAILNLESITDITSLMEMLRPDVR